MHQYCNNDVTDNLEEMIENADELSMEIGEIIEKLQLVQDIANKVEKFEFESQ